VLRQGYKGDITLVRKFEKRLSLSHAEETNNFVLAHCRSNDVGENFDRHVTRTLCQLII